MRDEWTDERMDDFRDEVYRRFEKLEGDVDRRFDKVEGGICDLRSEMKVGFDSVNDRLDGVNSRFIGLYRAQFVVGGGIIAALIGVIATQI